MDLAHHSCKRRDARRFHDRPRAVFDPRQQHIGPCIDRRIERGARIGSRQHHDRRSPGAETSPLAITSWSCRELLTMTDCCHTATSMSLGPTNSLRPSMPNGALVTWTGGAQLLLAVLGIGVTGGVAGGPNVPAVGP